MNALAPIPADELAWAVECALAGDTAEDLAECSGRPAGDWCEALKGQGVALRAPLADCGLNPRNRLIAERYVEGVSLEKIGEELGITGQRVSRLTRQLIARGVISKRPHPGLPAAAIAAVRGRVRDLYVAGELQFLPERNAAVLALVKAGVSYTAAGSRFGISRLAVAGIVYRDRQRRAAVRS